MKQKLQTSVQCFIILILLLSHTMATASKSYPDTSGDTKMYFCMAADDQHFRWLIHLIASIHKYDFDEVGEIAVFNLGFTPCQIEELNAIEKVKVYEVEKTNPNLLTFFTVRPNGRSARGWYAWKPVVIKQALEMFPYVLYMDSGVTLGMSMKPIFEHIRSRGYYLMGSGWPLGPTITKKVRKHFKLDTPKLRYIPSSTSMTATIQGLTRSMLKDYVLPMYELTKDLSFFEDDGSAPNGFGGARHDQSIASVLAYILHLEMFNYPYTPTLEDSNETTINIWDAIRFTRDKINLKYMKKFLRYRDPSKICLEINTHKDFIFN